MERHVYILADRTGVWATLRSRPMPPRVRGIKIRHVGTYQDDLAAWRDFEAAQWVVRVAGDLIFPEPPRRDR